MVCDPVVAAKRRGTGRRRFPPSSLRARLTLVAALVATVAFCVPAALVMTVAPAALQDDMRTRAELGARRVASQAERGELPPELLTFAEGSARADHMQVVAPGGRVMAASRKLAGQGPIATSQPGGFDQPVVLRAPLRLSPKHESFGETHLVVAVRARAPAGPVVVYSAVNVAHIERTVTALRLAVLIGTPSAVLLVTAVAWTAVGLTLRPVAAIRRRLERISGRDLGRRVPVPDSGDEIARLAATINDTLERLHRSAEAQRRFVADASHELRSPISALQTQLEVDAEYPDQTDWLAANRRALDATRRLAETVDELLTLARMDAGATTEKRPVDLSRLAAAQIRRRARERVPIHGDLTPEARVLGSPAQLDRLLTNLLDNAVRHARTRVDLSVAVEDRHVALTVADDGSGIAPEDRERVFQRFTRLKEGRRLDKGGSGLGLPLSREIARSHGGDLDIAGTSGGACFVLRLPRAPEGGGPAGR